MESVPEASTPRTRGLTILKFGGTSVASPENWRKIKEIAKDRTAAEGSGAVMLVCSALAGITDLLIEICEARRSGIDTAGPLEIIHDRHRELGKALGLDAGALLADDYRILDELIATENFGPREAAATQSMGEILSTRLGAAYLATSGVRTQWLDSTQMLQAKDTPKDVSDADGYLCNSPDPSANLELRADLDATPVDVFVAQGFVASADGENVLLGRGGSDTSATALAAVLRAEAVEIWTDVPGVFTADPRDHDEARLIQHLTYDEAHAVGALGASVLHPRCLEPLRGPGIPLRIGWTQRPEVSGTVIHPKRIEDHGPEAFAVSRRDHLVAVTMRQPATWQPVGFMAEVGLCFRKHGVSMDLVASSPSEIRATVDLASVGDPDTTLKELLDDLRSFCDADIETDVACVSIVGHELNRIMADLAQVILRLEDIQVHLTSCAPNGEHLSFVIDEDHCDDLCKTIHETLFDTLSAGGRFGPSWSELSADLGSTKAVA